MRTCLTLQRESQALQQPGPPQPSPGCPPSLSAVCPLQKRPQHLAGDRTGPSDEVGAHSLLSLGDLLDAVGFGLGRPLHGGDELLLLPDDLFLFDVDLLLALHHLDLDFLLADLLLLPGALELVGQLGLRSLQAGEGEKRGSWP